VTLIDTLVGSALMLIIFLGIAGAARLSIDVVSNNKARAGAAALAAERMEYLRSLPYTLLGTDGGVPSGALAASEGFTLNGISFTRRTVIQYGDDPKDGTGGSDPTGNADYKTVKVAVSWQAHTGERSLALVSRFEPAAGLESIVSGGTLVINVFDALDQALSGARVDVENAAASPAVDTTAYSNADGIVSLIGVPAASGYAITVSRSGYSDAATYASSAENPNPAPGHLTVSNGQTTSATFAIDRLASFTITTRVYGSESSLTNAAVTLRGAKTIGTDPTLYKFSAVVGGGASATTTVSNLEWDTYAMSVAASTGYDLASSCAPQPVALAAGESESVILYLAPHTAHSLPVKVTASSDGSLLSGASVRLYGSGHDVTKTTDACGQTLFSGLSAGTYSLSVSRSGYSTSNPSGIEVDGTTALYAVALN
jgi:hypothetical protein